jgi:hypothetical protein
MVTYDSRLSLHDVSLNVTFDRLRLSELPDTSNLHNYEHKTFRSEPSDTD